MEEAEVTVPEEERLSDLREAGHCVPGLLGCPWAVQRLLSCTELILPPVGTAEGDTCPWSVSAVVFHVLSLS